MTLIVLGRNMALVQEVHGHTMNAISCTSATLWPSTSQHAFMKHLVALTLLRTHEQDALPTSKISHENGLTMILLKVLCSSWIW